MPRTLSLLLVASLTVVVALAKPATADEKSDILSVVARLALPGSISDPFEKIDSVIIAAEPISDADLKLLAKLPALQSLNFFGLLPEGNLEALKAATGLRGLQFMRVKLKADHLQQIGAIAQLEALNFDHCDLAEEGLLALGNLKKLNSLSISPFSPAAARGTAKAGVLFATWYCGHEGGKTATSPADVRRLYCDESFDDEAVAACQFPNLQTLILPPKATDKTVAYLANWPKLQQLAINSPHVTNDSLKVICAAQGLRKLDLRGSGITAARIGELKQLETLQELIPPNSSLAILQALHEADLVRLLARREIRGTTLFLSGPGTNNVSLQLIDPEQKISTLVIDGSQVTDLGFQYLAKVKSLQEISFNSANIQGTEFQQLAALPNLQVLKLQYAKIDDRAGDGLAKLISLRELELNYTKVTPAIIPKLLPMKGLTHLRVPDETLTDETLELMAKHGRLHILEQFWRERAPADRDEEIQSAKFDLMAVTEKSLVLLRKTKVKSLIVPRHLTDAGLATIGSLESLEHVTIYKHQGITDAGFQHLANLKNLKSMVLTGSNVSDKSIELLRDLPKLNRLDLENTKITDATLLLAEKLPQLKSLSVHGTKVTDAGLRRFDKARPDCWLAAPFFVRDR